MTGIVQVFILLAAIAEGLLLGAQYRRRVAIAGAFIFWLLLAGLWAARGIE